MTNHTLDSVEPKWLLVMVFFISGIFFGGLAIYLYVNKTTPPSVRLHFPKGTYAYINPTIVSEPNISNNFSSVNNDLQLGISKIVSDTESQGGVTNAAVYFRDLEASKILAINADAQFSPGKLLKIPIMIAYYKLGEDAPNTLKQIITVKTGASTNEDVFDTKDTLTPGKYAVDDLVTSMVVDNSDTAANILFDHIDKGVLNEVFSNLGINFVEDKETTDFISLRRFSLFMRILYNASYLSNENSEKALSLLVNDPTPSLLEANVPHGISSATRLGGRRFVMKDGTKGFEIYECDIVYFPNHNYLLCASDQSKTLEDSKEFFSKIGDSIYANMNYQYGS